MQCLYEQCRFLNRALVRACAVLLLITASFQSVLADSKQSDRAFRIKAALVYYVAKFITWPSVESREGRGTFYVCVLGRDAVSATFPSVIEGKAVNGKRIQITELSSTSAVRMILDSCNAIYKAIDTNMREDYPSVERGTFARVPVLTVCGEPSLDFDCMVTIFEDANKAQVAVDRNLLARAGLVVSAELLEVAKTPPAGAQ